MNQQAPIEKIYTMSIVGGDESVKQVTSLNKAFDKLRETKKKLNSELSQALLDKKTTQEIDNLNNKIKDLDTQMKNLSVQRQKADKDAKVAAQVEKTLADIRLKEAQATKAQAQADRERTKSLIDQDKELDRLIAKEEKQNRVTQQTTGYYNTLNKELKDLLKIVKTTEKGNDLTFRGNLLSYDQAVAKLKELSAAEQEFRRQFQKDGTLVGEYTTGIVQAFKNVGLDDLIKNQIDKSKNEVRGLNQVFDDLKREYNEIKASGSIAFQDIEKKMIQNRAEVERLEKELLDLETKYKSAGTAGDKLATSLKLAFKDVGKQITTYALGFFGFQQLLAGVSKGFDTTVKLDSLDASLEVVSQSTVELAANEKFLAEITERLGLEYVSTAQAFKNFYAASTQAGLSAEVSRKIFENTASATAKLKLSQEDTNGVLLAFSQIASKGKVQAEELRGQIGERVPGAFAIAAKAIGVTQQELNGMLERGEVIASEFLPKFAAELQNTFGGDSQKEVQGLQANINRLQNEFSRLVQNNQTGITAIFSALIGGASLLIGILPTLITLISAYAVIWSIANAAMIRTRLATLASNIAYTAQYAILTIGQTITKTYTVAVNLLGTSFVRAAASSAILRTAISILTGPIGIVLGILSLLTISVVAFGRGTAYAAIAVSDFVRQKQAMNAVGNAAADIIAKETGELNRLFRIATSTTASIVSIKDAKQKLIEQFPDYFGKINAETASVQDLTNAYNAATAAIKQKAFAQASQKLAAEAQAKVDEVASIEIKLDNNLENGKRILGAFGGLYLREIEDLSESQVKILQDLDKRVGSTDGKTIIRDDSITKIKAALKTLREERQKNADDFNKIEEKYTPKPGEKGIAGRTIIAIQEDLKKANADFEKAVINSPEKKALEEKIKKLNAELKAAQIPDEKTKTYKGSTLTGQQKDLFKDVEAGRDELLALEKSKRLDGTIDEETYLKNILKINQDAIEKKLKLIKGKNAEERRIIADLKNESKELELKTNEDLFKIEEDRITKEYELQKQVLQNQLSSVENGFFSTDESKLVAKAEYNQKIIQLEQDKYNQLIALDKRYNIDSTQLEKEKSATVTSLKNNRNNQLPANFLQAQQISEQKKLDDAYLKLQYQLNQVYNDRNLTIDQQKVKVKQITDEYEKQTSKIKLDAVKTQLTPFLLLASLGLPLPEQAKELIKKYWEIVNNQSKQSAEEEQLKNSRKFSIQKLLQSFGFGQKNEGKSQATIDAENLQSIYQSAAQTITQFYQTYFALQQASIEKNKEERLSVLDSERDRRINYAQSAEERETINKKFEADREIIEKQAAEKKRKLALKQLTVDFAVATIKTFAQYGFPLGLIPAGFLLAQYLLKRSEVNAQQFAEGGEVQSAPLSSGLISVPSNIPTQTNGDNVFATVKTGEVVLNRRQQMLLGGSETFRRIGVPGFANGGMVMQRFMDGGGVQPPIVSTGENGRLIFGTDTFSGYANRDEDAHKKIDSIADSVNVLMAAVNATDVKKVIVVSTEVEAKNQAKKNASKVGAI